MKTYRKPKLRTRPSGWSDREVLIALLSLGVAAIGAIATAVSAFLTFQQVSLINRERMTPYRAILYSEKLKSYQLVTRSDHEARSPITEFYVDMGNGTYITPYLILMGGINHFKEGQPDEILVDVAKRLRPIILQYESTMSENSIVWPESVRKQLDGRAGDAARILDCLDAIIATERPTPFTPQKACEVSSAVASAKSLDENRDKVAKEMRALLISDETQRIG